MIYIQHQYHSQSILRNFKLTAKATICSCHEADGNDALHVLLPGRRSQCMCPRRFVIGLLRNNDVDLGLKSGMKRKRRRFSIIL